MTIHLDQKAEDLINELVKLYPNHYLKLFYDIEGCGCAGGVPAIAFVEKVSENDEKVYVDENLLLYVDSEMKLYGEEELWIKSKSNHTFML